MVLVERSKMKVIQGQYVHFFHTAYHVDAHLIDNSNLRRGFELFECLPVHYCYQVVSISSDPVSGELS